MDIKREKFVIDWNKSRAAINYDFRDMTRLWRITLVSTTDLHFIYYFVVRREDRVPALLEKLIEKSYEQYEMIP